MDVKTNELHSYLSAGYSGFWIKTPEPIRADHVIRELLKDVSWADGGKHTVTQWDLTAGSGNPNPSEPLKQLTSSLPERTVMLLYNYHFFIKLPGVIQLIQNSMEKWRNTGKAIIILSPFCDIPRELEKDFLVMNMPLPDRDEIVEHMKQIARSSEDSGGPKKSELMKADTEEIVNAAKGLTGTEIENVLALSIIKERKFDVSVIHEQKIQVIEKSGLIDVLKPNKTYDDIIGFDKMKLVVSKMIKNPASRGILIVGPPGCGKTAFMECTVGQFNCLGLMINFGRLFSKYQGVGFENVEEVIAIIEAIGRCVVIMDEFEKQFAGAASTGETDSGVARKMTGRWLTFMEDRPEGIYMMGTCNSFEGIPDEYLRARRWDSSPFYIDLPGEEEKELIFDYYMTKQGLEKMIKPDADEWTGAEIEACCLMAKNLDCSLIEASEFINPQNKGGFKEAKKLREIAVPATSIRYGNGKRKTRRLNT